MTTICQEKVKCFPCQDEPIENLSGEGPDNPSFLGVFRPPTIPRLSIPFESKGCVRWCFSEVSQEEADHCAELQALECQEEDVFYSATKTCEIICPNGLGIAETVEAGTVISFISQEDADTRAAALACRKANLTACSVVVLPVGNEAQGVSCIEGTDLISNVELPENLSISGPTLTVEAGSFSAPTLAEANALAAQYVSDYMNAGLASGDLTCIECNDNGHGDERPFVDPASFSALAGCSLTGDATLPEWDGWLRVKTVSGTGTGFCSYQTPDSGFYITLMGKSVRAFLSYNAVADRWQFLLEGFDSIGNGATYWRGNKAPAAGSADDSGAFPRFTSCPTNSDPPASITITFGIPP